MSEFRREGLAWAAGFFDGEGSFLVDRQDGYPYPRVNVGQTDPEPLYRLMTTFNSIGSVNGPYTRSKTNHAPMYYYAAHGFEKVQAIMAMMWPFLCGPKKRQAAQVMTEALPHARMRAEKVLFCPKGHAMTEENTVVYTQGPGWKSRRCRMCIKENDKRAYERKLARQDAEAELLRQMLNGEAS